LTRRVAADLVLFLSLRVESPRMTALSFDETGVDVVYNGTEFRLEKDLIEDAIQKSYPEVTDHEVLQIVEETPELSGEPRRIADIIHG
jgi:hypothetical protein